VVGIAVIIVILSIILILLWPKTPKAPEAIRSTAELDKYLNEFTAKGSMPGLSLIVVKKDSVIYSKGYGWADIPRKIKATPMTVYHWFSVTKIVTALSIVQLHEQGKLHINDPVTKYLPYFDVKYPSDSSKTITIRNLLNHSAGLPGAGMQIIKWIHHEGEPHWNQTEFLKKVLPDYSKILFEPGEKTSYTNIAYMVLGAIIEEVTNQTYEDYLRQNILGPL
jgi:CubicO group peptidase (beta-lactamase class C family)